MNNLIVKKIVFVIDVFSLCVASAFFYLDGGIWPGTVLIFVLTFSHMAVSKSRIDLFFISNLIILIFFGLKSLQLAVDPNGFRISDEFVGLGQSVVFFDTYIVKSVYLVSVFLSIFGVCYLLFCAKKKECATKISHHKVEPIAHMILVFICMLIVLYWVMSNGGFSFFINRFEKAYEYRNGLITDNYSMLKYAVYPFVFSSVVLVYNQIKLFYLSKAIYLLLAVLIYSINSSASEVTLYFFLVFLLHMYSKKTISHKVSYLYGLVAFVLFLFLMIALKSIFSSSASVGGISENFISTFVQYLLNLPMVFTFIMNKFNTIDSIAFTYYYTDLYGFDYFQPLLNGMISVVPSSIFQIDSYPTVGNLIMSRLSSADSGGTNPTFIGVFFLMGGFFGVVFYSLIFSFLLLSVNNRTHSIFSVAKKNISSNDVLLIIFITFLFIYFIRTGLFDVTLRRVFVAVLWYMSIQILCRFIYYSARSTYVR